MGSLLFWFLEMKEKNHWMKFNLKGFSLYLIHWVIYAGEGMCCVVGSRYEFSLSLFFRIEQQINDLSKREKRKTWSFSRHKRDFFYYDKRFSLCDAIENYV